MVVVLLLFHRDYVARADAFLALMAVIVTRVNAKSRLSLLLLAMVPLQSFGCRYLALTDFRWTSVTAVLRSTQVDRLSGHFLGKRLKFG